MIRTVVAISLVLAAAPLLAQEDNLAACSDGIDNDADDFIDCADFDCAFSEDAALRELCAGPESDVASCDNGIDDDDDGFIDCADFDCSRSPDPALVELCNDGVPFEAEDSVALCSDGLDNDQNNFIDCADFSCSQSEDPNVSALCAGEGEGEGEGPPPAEGEGEGEGEIDGDEPQAPTGCFGFHQVSADASVPFSLGFLMLGAALLRRRRSLTGS